VPFATPSDVDTAHEGTLPAEDRVQFLLDSVSARLRILLPTLEERIIDSEDLGILAKDIVVQAVIRRLPGSTTQNIQSQTQTAGPWSTTVRYTTDTSGTFTDEDLRLLGGTTSTTPAGSVGTIKTGPLVDWFG
jgi:hypothetical protein